MNDALNPLVPTVLHLLRTDAARGASSGISEYELLKQLEATGVNFSAPGVEPDLLLFKKHFLLMNALYRLQDTLWQDERVWLSISPLRIAFEAQAALEEGGGSALDAAADGALRDYYLDWHEFESTDGLAVTALLNGFWQRLHAVDARAQALRALQLDADADWGTVQAQYRRLAAATHPDRGGDGAQFLVVREAYEILRVAMRR
jgi:hypothetical protein